VECPQIQRDCIATCFSTRLFAFCPKTSPQTDKQTVRVKLRLADLGRTGIHDLEAYRVIVG
jgi:hypothetical protein